MTNDLLDAIERVKTLSPELQSNAARVLIDFADHCDTPSIQLTDAQLAEVQIARQEVRHGMRADPKAIEEIWSRLGVWDWPRFFDLDKETSCFSVAVRS